MVYSLLNKQGQRRGVATQNVIVLLGHFREKEASHAILLAGASIGRAHMQLLTALADQKSSTDRSVVAKQLIQWMLKLRRAAKDKPK